MKCDRCQKEFGYSLHGVIHPEYEWLCEKCMRELGPKADEKHSLKEALRNLAELLGCCLGPLIIGIGLVAVPLVFGLLVYFIYGYILIPILILLSEIIFEGLGLRGDFGYILYIFAFVFIFALLCVVADIILRPLVKIGRVIKEFIENWFF